MQLDRGDGKSLVMRLWLGTGLPDSSFRCTSPIVGVELPSRSLRPSSPGRVCSVSGCAGSHLSSLRSQNRRQRGDEERNRGMGLPVDWMKFNFAATAYQSYIFSHEIPFGVLLFLARPPPPPPPGELICLELAMGTPLHLYQSGLTIKRD